LRITVRLYKRHDLDLLALYGLENYDFKTVFKSTLKAYVAGEPIRNQIPKVESKKVSDMPPKIIFHIVLNDDDTDIQKWLKTITVGRRNTMLKNIVRNSFPVILSPYLRESEKEIFKIGAKKYDV